MLSPQKPVHFVGIGGAGMSAIAKILLELGYSVSGSDLKPSAATKRLEDMGAIIHIGHSRQNVDDPEFLVVSSAIPEANVEVVAATEAGIPILQRGEMLARLLELRKGIAVAGSHGKTTTTSMISLMLEKLQLDPTVLIGGELNDIGGNAKLGQGEYLVAEADESDGSFLKLFPEVGVVTNIEDDHLDYYGTVANIVASFEQFVSQVKPTGFAVLCTDNDYVRKIAENATSQILTYGLETGELRVQNITAVGLGTTSRVYYQGQELGELVLNVPGHHNVANALAAVAVGLKLGFGFAQVAEALATFRGVHRRFELVGEVNGIKVVDDYGHHPTEVKVTLEAARQANFQRVIAVFQPHRYSRTKFLYQEFGASFGAAHQVIITDVYPAGEKPIPGVTGQLIADSITSRGQQQVNYIPRLQDVAAYLRERVQSGDLVITIGAGDVRRVGEELVEMLGQKVRL